MEYLFLWYKRNKLLIINRTELRSFCFKNSPPDDFYVYLMAYKILICWWSSSSIFYILRKLYKIHRSKRKIAEGQYTSFEQSFQLLKGLCCFLRSHPENLRRYLYLKSRVMELIHCMVIFIVLIHIKKRLGVKITIFFK